ncbi:hypothetical protein GCM10010102_21420 [Promicromonospora citrea]|uniref:Uncharacterized protein n=1 Tax=Promicromonospora citrea TaxID=43677 RepID=A0A8H9L438_9MICO|nr:hypothetical protein GCM10010102_21420 [Promicromonospora citrea]
MSWASASVEPRSTATCGSAGRYMSTVKAGSAERAPSMSTHLTVDREEVRRAGMAEETPDGAADGMRTMLSNRYDRGKRRRRVISLSERPARAAASVGGSGHA